MLIALKKTCDRFLYEINDSIMLRGNTYFQDDDSYFDDSKTIYKVVEVLEKYLNVAAVALPYFEPNLERRHFIYNPDPGNDNPATIWQVANYTACAAAFRREAVKEIGGYCEDFFFAVEEDELSTA